MKEIKILEADVHVNLSNDLFDKAFPPSTTMQLRTSSPKSPQSFANQIVTKRSACVFCTAYHPSSDCNKVTDPKKRFELVKAAELCFNCLGHHKVSACTSKGRCKTCRRKHHTSLCQNPNNSNLPKQQSDIPPTPTPPVTPIPVNQRVALDCTSDIAVTPPSLSTLTAGTCLPTSNTTTLLKTAIAPLQHDSTIAEANILFDEGAQRSFISKHLAETLDMILLKQEAIMLSTFGATKPTLRIVDLAIVHVIALSGETIPIKVLIIPKIAVPLQSNIYKHLHSFPYLYGIRLAHPIESAEKFPITLLVGADHYWDIVGDDIIQGDGPTAMQSKLGYLLSGPVSSTAITSEATTNMFFVMTSHKEEEFNLEKFWQLESIGILNSPKNDHDTFLENYQAPLKKGPNGAYIAKLPWKQEHEPLPNNYLICEKRTRSMVKRLSQTPNLLEHYNSILVDQESCGFIEKVPMSQDATKAHFIPHHPVIKDSLTTPVRIVYDCSCRQSSMSPSLNDCLTAGPPLQNDMCAILIRFRIHNFAFSTDLGKAFLHIQLDEEDRVFISFLWPTDPKDLASQCQAYRFTVILFGLISSPFSLNANCPSPPRSV